MSYSPGVGLILNLGLDSSGIDPGLNDAEKALGGLAKKTGEQFADAGKKTDDALLSNRETARLLSEELGVHLPRAVTSALSEMLPGIGGLGTALLGVFAVEEVVKFGKAAAEMLHEMQGETKQLAEDWKAVTEEQGKLLTHPEDRLQAEARIRDTLREQSEVSARIEKLRKDQVEDAKYLSYLSAQGLLQMHRETEELNEQEALERKLQERLAEQHGALAKLTHEQSGYNLEVKKAQDAAAEVSATRRRQLQVEIGEIQAELDLELQKAGQNEDKKNELRQVYAARRLKLEREETVEIQREEQKRATEAEEQITRMTALMDRLAKKQEEWHKEWLKSLGMPEEAKFSIQEIARAINSAGMAALKTLPSLTALGGGFHQLTEEQRAALPVSSRVNDELLRTAQHIRDVTAELETGQLPAMRRVQVEYAKQVEAINREIAAERRDYLEHKITRAEMEADERAYTQAMVDLAKQRKQGEQEAAEATIQTMAQEIATFVGAIAGRKAQAEVEGGFYLAEGAFDIARGIWPPNPVLIARGLGEIGAGIDMLKVAGVTGKTSSATGAGGGGGGSVGGAHDDHGGGGRSDDNLTASAPSGSTSASTALVTRQPGGGNFHVIVLGESDGANYVASILNNHVENGGGRLVASHVGR
jgi:hypothetical protein